MRSQIICVAALLVAVLSVSAPAADWTTPVPVQSGINTQYSEVTPYLSYDGLSLYFARTVGTARIFEAKRSQPSGNFTSVSQVLSSPSGHVYTPWVSSDNLRMYYHEEAGGPWQIKVSTRASSSDPWSQGTAVAGLPSSSICEESLSADELTMVFNNPLVGNWDMYIATRPDKNSAFDNIRSLSEINTSGHEERPFLSPDALSIYYCDGTSAHIFEATRQSLNDPFGNIQHLSAFDMPGGSNHPDMAINSDGTAFYFVSGSNADIYVSYLVPEPATLVMMGIGGVLLRRFKK
jgi:hypothetical protein